ncbi:testis-expressed protein 2 [Melitaea cinxia]|uniref:testis-expressed protein 2 n=1 Tax=Melitaea cinxia TaxID=113334 RepID=UPI001E271069|nr:testis-expressed protein 2 [Melitaea cinxia]
MEVSGAGKSPNTSLSFRYNANNEELEELFQACEDDPPTPQPDPPVKTESASPKKTERSSSIIDKYFKSMRTEKLTEKVEDVKQELKSEENRSPVTPKEVTSSPMKEYLNRLGKRSASEVIPEGKEANETWKIFHDFKFKIAQAVEDMKTRSVEETKEKVLPRENSTSDSEESSVMKDCDQQSMGDTDNQVSSLDSSMQNLSDMTQPLTAKPTDNELCKELNATKNHSDSSEDTHKNLNRSESDLTKELQDSLEVESGVEALEDTIDAFGDLNQIETDVKNQKRDDSSLGQPIATSSPTNFGLPPSKNNLLKNEASMKPKTYFLKFSMYLLTIFLLLNYILFPNCNVWNGFLLGIWCFYFASNLKEWVLDNYFSDEPRKGFFQLNRSNSIPLTYTIPSVKEHRPLKKYEGWMNHYRYPDYDPYTYHINKTTTAFMKLEGCNLRISYTRTKVAKRALWDEKIEKVTFYQHRLYNLTGAKVILLPEGLVKRRQWSKKYPICIILNEKEKIQVLEKENTSTERKMSESMDKKGKEVPQETESIETNTSPEKKKKFIWRRKEKSLSHNDEKEPGKEGLRQRFARKMHRDKKTDNTSTNTEPENQGQVDKNTQQEELVENEVELTTKSVTSTKDDDEDLDESELSRIKEFLEETEIETGMEGAAEGEWSVHVKQSKDKHSHLYLFARTGRDKHEWYRRIMIAISEANASADNSGSDEKSTSDNAQETKDGVELAVYKLSEKDTVAFAKSKTNDSVTEGVTISSISHPPPTSFSLSSYEKTFWPYMQKIIQTHEVPTKQKMDVGVMCQLEPSPHERKHKKKKKGDMQNSSPDCECRALPAELTWMNTLLARLMFDVTRDPHTAARLQNRIQRKLNTLKLPSFMSPLVVTELRLAGACPLLCGVGAPGVDARGLWLHAHLRYDGGATITILTQINLMKLKEKNVTLEEQILGTSENVVESEVNIGSMPSCVSPELKRRKPAIYDSDVEDSAESSSDDESPPVQPVDSAESVALADTVSSTNEGGSSKKKFLRMVDKIATNKYFQQVTDYKYVKRAMEGLSNTDIKLQLDVHGLEGILAINLPPPPHDRLWIGFSTNPQLVLKARPAVGARTLRFAHISNWIEQKLTKEFEKVLVLPNMEDIIIDVLTPTPVEFER